MQRISIHGASCAGKTMLGRELARRLDVRFVDIDELSWEPGWQIVPTDVLSARLEAALEVPYWVASGNNGRVREKYLPLADTLIWLDYSFLVIMRRALRRTLSRVVRREPCCNGNYESWRGVFSRDSILLWVLKDYRKRRRQYPMKFALPEYAHLQVLHFRSPREAERWLETVVSHHQRG